MIYLYFDENRELVDKHACQSYCKVYTRLNCEGAHYVLKDQYLSF